MINDWNSNEKTVTEALEDRTDALLEQRRYYGKLHFINLSPVIADDYFESLKDWSRFSESKDTSRRDANHDAGITFSLKVKAHFSVT